MTKGNATYGNQDGVIGAFDIVIRTNLNGRQAQWRVFWYHDLGPSLSFASGRINCREDVALAPDSYCGSFFVDRGDGAFPLPPDVTSPPLIYGDRVTDSNEYYGQISGYFTPRGYPRYTIGALNTARMNCYGTDNCYFPQ